MACFNALKASALGFGHWRAVAASRVEGCRAKTSGFSSEIPHLQSNMKVERSLVSGYNLLFRAIHEFPCSF